MRLSRQTPEPKRIPTRPLLPIPVAKALLQDGVASLSVVTVELAHALGRVLAVDLIADADQPAFMRSVMDGFALRSADCLEPGAVLAVVGAAPAGSPYLGEVGERECVRVMTGSVIPRGADAVVPVEQVELVEGELSRLVGSRWKLKVAIQAGQDVVARGSEVRAGSVVVPAGSTLDPAKLGVAAAFGHTQLVVTRRPVVALLPTGDEVVSVAASPRLGQVRDSNRSAIAAVSTRAGAEVRHREVAPDHRAELTLALSQAADDSDVVVTSGGVSMGDYDLVAAALRDAGADLIFHRLALKPGRPMLAAKLKGAYILCLPGNPVSSLVCSQLFLRPLLAALQGAARRDWVSLFIPLAKEMPATGPRAEIRPGRFVSTSEGTCVEMIQTGGSADLAGFSACEIFLHRPAAAPKAVAGEVVQALIWPEGA